MKTLIILSTAFIISNTAFAASCDLTAADSTGTKITDIKDINKVKQRSTSLIATLNNKKCTDPAFNQFVAAHNYLCENIKITDSIDIKAAGADVNQTLYAAHINNKKSTVDCLEAAKSGLKLEIDLRKKTAAVSDTSQIEQEVETINLAIAQNNQEKTKFEELASQGFLGVVAKAEENKNLRSILSDTRYMASFFVGVNLMPEYNEQGQNEGFQETNFFGKLDIDLRGNAFKIAGAKFAPFHIGVSLEFRSENVFDCELANQQLDPMEEARDCAKDISDLSSIRFNDISNTVNTSAYGLLNIWQSKNQGAEIGINTRIGMQSRNKLKENGDSINQYHHVGIRWTGSDPFWNEVPGINSKKGANALPKFYIETNYAEYEEFAGLGKSYRNVTRSAYRPYKDKPLYIGIDINGGEGPDDIAVFLSYGLSAKSIFNIF